MEGYSRPENPQPPAQDADGCTAYVKQLKRSNYEEGSLDSPRLSRSGVCRYAGHQLRFRGHRYRTGRLDCSHDSCGWRAVAGLTTLIALLLGIPLGIQLGRFLTPHARLLRLRPVIDIIRLVGVKIPFPVIEGYSCPGQPIPFHLPAVRACALAKSSRSVRTAE